MYTNKGTIMLNAHFPTIKQEKSGKGGGAKLVLPEAFDKNCKQKPPELINKSVVTRRKKEKSEKENERGKTLLVLHFMNL